MQTLLNVLLVILLLGVIALVVLYFLGRKMEKRQVEQQQMLEAAAQTVSMLVIDKKKLKVKDAGLPKIVSGSTAPAACSFWRTSVWVCAVLRVRGARPRL